MREGGEVKRGESEEQARTEGLIYCRRRKEGGVCVRKLNELTTAVSE